MIWTIRVRSFDLQVEADLVEATDFGIRIERHGDTAYIDITEPFEIIEPPQTSLIPS